MNSKTDTVGAGSREARPEGSLQHTQQDATEGEVDDDDEGDESSEGAAYLEGIELSEDENWPATAWREQSAPPALGAAAQLSGAASSRQRSCTVRNLLEIKN